MSETFTCSCGAMEWQVARPRDGTRLICYCADCQTFQRHLGNDILDPEGGTDLLQVAPSQLTFTRGAENLRVLRLSPRGLMRWHSGCCNTGVCNTLASPKLAFCSIMTAPHGSDARIRDKALGRVRARVNTVWARGSGKPARDSGLFRLVYGYLARMLSERISGRWRQTPFFAGPGMAPVSEPVILSKQERTRARP